MSVVEDLEKIQKLKEQGILSDEEFEKEKQKILGENVKKEKATNNVPQNINKVIKNVSQKIKENKTIHINKVNSQHNKKICNNCGNEISEEEKFCGKCGNKIKKYKLKKRYVITICIACLLIICSLYYNNTVVTDEYLTLNFKENGFEQYDDVYVEILALTNITYNDYKKLAIVNIEVTIEGTSISRTGILLINKKEDIVDSFTINNNLLYLLSGVANANKSENPSKIAEICVNYIQDKGTDFLNDTTSKDFKNFIREVSNIDGIEESREYVKTEFTKTVSWSNLDYTLLFDKKSALVKYIAFYETTVEFNSKWPMSEYIYKNHSSRSIDNDTLELFTKMYGPAYITVQEYTVYEIGTYTTEEEFENSKVGSYDSIEEIEETLYVED